MIDYGKVSVIVATYNMAQYVCLAIETVLQQTYSNLEVIVVNDGSTDETELVLQTYASHPQVKIIHQANQGQTVAKNIGIKNSSGVFIGFCDADDLWLPDKLEKQLACFAVNPRVGVVYSEILEIGPDSKPLGQTCCMKHYSGRVTDKLLIDNFVHFVSALVRRQAVEDFGGFREELRMGIDLDLWLRISTKYEIQFIDEVLAYYRVWPGQMSRKGDERLNQYFAILRDFEHNYPGAVNKSQLDIARGETIASRGWVAYLSGDSVKGLEDVCRAIKLNPGSRRAWRFLIKILLRWKR